MSGLSNQEVTTLKEFDADLFVRTLCENKKVTISDFCEINFMEGWKALVEELFAKISNYSITITQISDAHAQLDISFNVINNTKELLVWRAIENTRQKSRSTCALCGENTYELRQNKNGLLCRDCTQNSSTRGQTGTWLDKY